MSYSDYDDFFGEFPHDDIVRETLKEESFGSSSTCRTGHVCERNNFVFEKVDNSVNCVVELYAQPGMLLLVPGRRFNRLFSGLLKDS